MGTNSTEAVTTTATSRILAQADVALSGDDAKTGQVVEEISR